MEMMDGTTEQRLFSQLKEYIEIVATSEGGYLNSLFVFGKGGFGKTKRVLDTLDNLKAQDKLKRDYVYHNNYTTIVELINFLHTHNGEIIIFDDFEKLLTHPVAISCLKGALWGIGQDNKRLISYLPTSNQLTAPSQFEFNGKIIFLVNELPKENPFLKALFSRSIVYNLDFDYADLMLLLEEISQKDYKGMSQENKTEVFNFIRDETDEDSTKLSIRTLFIGFNFFLIRKDNWKELLLPFLEKDANIVLLRKIIGETATMREAQSQWSEQTGLSRRSFFRYKVKYRLNTKKLNGTNDTTIDTANSPL